MFHADLLRVDKHNRHLLYAGLVFLTCYILLAIIAMRPVAAFDTFWHLQMGRDLIEQNLSPWVDHYSVRYEGNVIDPVPVMFQVLLYKFVNLFGEQDGFYYIRLFYITLMMLVLWVYFRKIQASAFVVFILLPLVVSAISLRIIIRPELFSFVFVVVCLMLYMSAQKKFATKEMLAICLLLLFWTSYHSPVLGYIIIFGLFLEKAINKLIHRDESYSWCQWSVWGLLIFSIGFINLNNNGHSIIGSHFIVSTINIMSDNFGQYIQEYSNSYITQSTNVLTHVSWILSIYVVAWSWIKKQYGFVFIVAFLTFLSWSTVRMLAVVLLINMCVLALYWTQFLNTKHYLNLNSAVKKTLFVVSVCISLLAFYLLSDKAQHSIKLDGNRLSVLEKRYPVQVTNYLKYYQDGGNILNYLRFGGYLLYELSPDYKIYYDGRSNILYPIEFVEHNIELWHSAKTVDEVVERYDISYVLRENSPEIHALLKQTEELELSFADDNYLLYSRTGKAEFPLASILLAFPRCVINDHYQLNFSQGIQEEIERSEKLFSGKQYTLKIVLEFIKVYLAAEDKDAFFSTLRFERKHSDGVRRIALHFAMSDADIGTVSDIFKAIGKKNYHDILLYSYYMAKNGEYEDAENLAYYFYTLDEVGEVPASYDKYGILGRVFRILKEHDQIQKFEASYVDELEANLKKINYPFERELSFDFMCK